MKNNLVLPVMMALAAATEAGKFAVDNMGLLGRYASNSYKYIHHRSQKKLRRLTRQRGGKSR